MGEGFVHKVYKFLIYVLEISLKILRNEVKDSLRAAFAEGTHKNLQVQWRAYFLFLCVNFMD